MTTNDIGAIRDQAQQYSGATGANQSYRAHVLAHRVPALCNEVEQLRAELDRVRAVLADARQMAHAFDTPRDSGRVRVFVGDLRHVLHRGMEGE